MSTASAIKLTAKHRALHQLDSFQMGWTDPALNKDSLIPINITSVCNFPPVLHWPSLQKWNRLCALVFCKHPSMKAAGGTFLYLWVSIVINMTATRHQPPAVHLSSPLPPYLPVSQPPLSAWIYSSLSFFLCQSTPVSVCAYFIIISHTVWFSLRVVISLIVIRKYDKIRNISIVTIISLS